LGDVPAVVLVPDGVLVPDEDDVPDKDELPDEEELPDEDGAALAGAATATTAPPRAARPNVKIAAPLAMRVLIT
jgi:hypothetical protein